MTIHDTPFSTSASMAFDIIGTIESCYPDKFGIPRQPGLAPSATAILRFNTPFDHPDGVRGLEQFSHLWISFLFHQSPKRWTPLIRPPRLGGNARIGVFASRSTHRPNRLGLSLVELVGIEYAPTLALILRGHDLVDATPVVDIKPYLPWADSVDSARAGFAPEPPPLLKVEFSDECRQTLNERADGENLAALIGEVLAQDPRPAYRRKKHDDRRYGVRLFDLDVRFHVDAGSHGHESIIVVDRLVQMT
ncbi:tRNA (N6-threonylcarbamoyladenosine(37)-N6)-methyltransferase TrmO [Kushneria konosiri]|uniref:tRNA (N6-threonylcarbamoyladenosine(37)-N6)-methyltransferase TrmO n=1 Tax=Kushneria konosiri TaxID=698828 RepID=A0A2Z2H7G1_9GAMM|nr:tRNA (N6-threonylcarbamoyladenosine(37)-N6)-methyltransferase TrmO [Kushneria konosiri]ARS53413.1 tRNA (N6-threonylcarbamoyladenosine(37)-N6)-methyltransferase TrmO [Kushneria konosiri]